MPYKDRKKYLKYQRDYQKLTYRRGSQAGYWRWVSWKYNLTRDQFFDILEKQDNKCAVCERVFESFQGNKLHIDHCHRTNKVRGLLCMPCNVAIGALGDTEEGVLRALEYLRRAARA